jgi:hypothetical protein
MKKQVKYFLVEAIGKQTGAQAFVLDATSMTAAKKALKEAGFKVTRIVESALTKP